MESKSRSFVKIDPDDKESESEDDFLYPLKNLKEESLSPTRFEQNLDDEMAGSLNGLKEVCKQRSISSAVELNLQDFFKQRPRITPLPPSRSSVDINLTDPDEETWIIECPASIDIQNELLGKKINLSAPQSKIKNCSIPLEVDVRTNSTEQIIGMLAGPRIKSFVPTGFVRIKQSLPTLGEPDLSGMIENNNVVVPYPVNIRQRHPMLGNNFKECLALPKRVKKLLSVAQQKAALLYSETPLRSKSKRTDKPSKSKNAPPVLIKQEPYDSHAPSPSKAKKRKQPTAADVTKPVDVKQEPMSPSAKKKKPEPQEAANISIKKEPLVEDDISWLLNI
ncbi:uncharacterized protein LOC128723159 [Anopheles nili]|uniref:uncharacterized protein LOC128723159 n=1 Tax=Anopheles nili TaxID=185578 RepID=UPI00237AA1E7|nr:uncharacterized protein LOC128723159 [Anopheles nili]